MDFLHWLKQFDCEARSQVNLDHRELGLDLSTLQLQFEQGLAPLAVFGQVQADLNMLPFAEFTLQVF